MNFRQPDVADDGPCLGEIQLIGRRGVGVVINTTEAPKSSLTESLGDAACPSEQVDDGEWWPIGRRVAACVLPVLCAARHGWILTF